MQKHQKRKKKSLDNKLPSWRKKRKRYSTYLQKNIKSSGRPFFNITLNSLKKKDFFRVDMGLFPNNVFCSLKDIKKNKLISSSSAGKYKIKVSKKRLKYASKVVITNFFKELKQKSVHFVKPIVLVLVSPSNLRKRVILDVLKVLKYVKKKRIIVYIKPKKIFNGCRVKKQMRKKRKRFAIYK